MMRKVSFIFFVLILLILGIAFAYSPAPRYPLTIEVHSDSPDLNDNIRLFVEMESRLHRSNWTRESLESFLHQTQKKVEQAVFPYGYFHAKMNYHVQQGTDAGKPVWRVVYSIQTGIPLKWRNITLTVQGEGRDNKKIKDAMRVFGIQRGQTFNTIEYEKAKEKWIQTASNQGYVNAFFSEKKVKINARKEWADVSLTLDTGKQFYFGALHIESKAYSRSFLKRFLNIHRRQPFSSKKLVQLEEEMNGSGYFKQVLVHPEFELEKQGQVPVNISVEAPLSQRYKVGVGYGSFAGFRVSGEANFPHLNQDGHQLSTRVNASSILSGFNAKYSIPGKRPQFDQYSFGINAQKFIPEKGNSFSQVYSLGYSTRGKRWTLNGSVNYLTERFTINKDQPDVYRSTSRLLYPTLAFNYFHSDDLLNPTHGMGFYVSASAGSSALLSITDFFQWQGKLKYMYSFSDRNQLLARGGIGYTTVHDLMNLPLSMRFFAGGSSTIRGYQDSSIGPGKYLEYAGVEYRHRLFGEAWRGALFWDGGIASDEFRAPWINSYGVGLIYQSFIGPIRLYLASIKGDLNGSTDKRKLAVDFSFGAEFS